MWPERRWRGDGRACDTGAVTGYVRRAAALAGAPLAALAALGILLLAVIATSLLRAPNADPTLDGDPCCPHPDSWLEVAFGALATIALVVVALALIMLAVALGWVGVTGRAPKLARRHQDSLGLVVFASAGGLFSLPMVLAFAMSLLS
jgi:hypothetical protein